MKGKERSIIDQYLRVIGDMAFERLIRASLFIRSIIIDNSLLHNVDGIRDQGPTLMQTVNNLFQ